MSWLETDAGKSAPPRILASEQVTVRNALRYGLPLAFGGVCLWILIVRLGPDVLTGLGPALRHIAPYQWGLALLATTVSFWAVGRYDVVIHRHLRTQVPVRHAATSGAAAIALAQVLGIGVISGALVRWRMVPGLSPRRALRISLTVAISFLAGLAVCILLVGLILRPQAIPTGVIWGGALALMACVIMGLRHPVVRLFGWRCRVPSVLAMGQIAALTAIDTAAAALAFHILLPSGTGIGFELVLPAYLLALGAALLSGTPGGVGPFELVMLTMLPVLPENSFLATIMAFRLTYYALPALSALWVLRRPLRAVENPARALSRLTFTHLRQAPRAELGVCRQNNARLLVSGGTRLAVVETTQTACALFDPVSGDTALALPSLLQYARQRNLIACVYKASARHAARARAAGWYALHVADEAVVDIAQFDVSGRACRQLRRKLRQADKAGVTITSPTPLPYDDLKHIDASWQARTGPARGLSMGRFCPDHLAAQKVFVAWQDGQPVGFASFHVCDQEICLDLMRWCKGAPTGTMHSLVAKAIDFARQKGCPRLSLAAMPPKAPHVMARCTALGLGAGLGQFKSAFAPVRQPLYALAPSRFALFVALADISLSIRRPARMPAHDLDEDFAFAPTPET